MIIRVRIYSNDLNSPNEPKRPLLPDEILKAFIAILFITQRRWHIVRYTVLEL